MLTRATPAGTWSIPPPILFLPAGSRQLLLCWGQLEMSEKVPSVCLSSWGKMNNSLPIRRLGDIGQQKVTMSSSLNSNWLNVSHWQARRRDNAVVTFLQRFWRPFHPPPATQPPRHWEHCATASVRLHRFFLFWKASVQTIKPKMLHSRA